MSELRIAYAVGEENLPAQEFIEMVNQVWPGDYDVERTRQALNATLNITARANGRLIGCVRVLTDGYFFGTITEILVIPEFQRCGVGSELLRLVREHTPTSLYFGAQPGKEAFYEKNGFQRGMQSFALSKKRGEQDILHGKGGNSAFTKRKI